MKKDQVISQIVQNGKSFLYGRLLWEIEDKESYKEFKDKEEAKRWGNVVYSNWAENYKKKQRQIRQLKTHAHLCIDPVEQYCGYTYEHINAVLRGTKEDKTGIYEQMINLLLWELYEAPRIPCDLVLYRLVSDEFVDKLIKCNRAEEPVPLQEKGFMSTSLCKDITSTEGHYLQFNKLLKIYVEKGTVGAYTSIVAGKSEEEMLLLPNRYLALVEYPYIDAGKEVYECKLLSTELELK